MYKIIIILTLIAASSAQYLPNGCPSDFHIHFLLPHETDCGKYYHCIDGQKLEDSCTSGMHFDSANKICNDIAVAECTLSATTTDAPITTTASPTTKSEIEQLPIECPANSSIPWLLPHEYDCAKYYQCTDGIKVEKDCAPGTWFGFGLQDCDVSMADACTTTSTTPSTTTVDPTTTVVPTTTVITTTTVAPTMDIIFFLPHELSCAKYYQCVQGNKVEKDCGPGTWFDPKLQVCNEIFEVNCKLGAGTKAPTTTTQATTTTIRGPMTTTKAPTTTTGAPSTITIAKTLITTASNTTTIGLSTTTKDFDLTETTTPILTSTTGFPIPEFLRMQPGIEFLPNGCPVDTQIYSMLPHEYDCAKFYHYDQGKKSEKACASGTWFDFSLQVCSDPSSVTCTSITTTTPTPEPEPTAMQFIDGYPIIMYIDYFLPHEISCAKYYQCIRGSKVEKDCGPGTWFDAELQVCNQISTVKCTLGTIEWTTTVTEPYITTTETFTTTTETSTTRTTEATTATTAASTITTEASTTLAFTTSTKNFNATTEAFTLRTETFATTTEGETITIDPTEMPRIEYIRTQLGIIFTSNGCPVDTRIKYFSPHESNCAKFYTYDQGKKVAKDCAQGQWFDFKLQACNQMSMVSCKRRKKYRAYKGIPKKKYVRPIPKKKGAVKLSAKVVKPSITTEVLETETTTEITEVTTEDESSPESSTTTFEGDQTTAAVSSCLDGYVGNMAHPELCNQYFKCTGDEEALLESCSDGMEFDPETKACVEIAEGGCNSLQDETSPSEDTPITDTSLPSSPIESDLEVSASIETTPNPLATTDETESEQTNIPSESNSEAIEETAGDETDPASSTTTSECDQSTAALSSCPDGYVGNMAHPGLCNQYFKCTGDEEPLLESCDEGLEFHPEAKECVEIAEGGCGSLQPETSPPEGTTTMDAYLQASQTQSDSEASAATEMTPNPSATTDETKPNETNEQSESSSEVTEATSGDESSPESSTTTSKSGQTTAAVSSCPDGYVGNMAHPELCNQYFKCSGDEEPLLESCNDEMEFDPETKECVDEAASGCTSTLDTTDTYLETLSTEPNSQHSITQINSGEETTPAPAVTEIKMIKLSISGTLKQQKITTTIEPIKIIEAMICPDGYVGNMAHPELCNQYFKCTGDEEPLLESCSDGLEFDPATKECVEIAESGCGSLQPETSLPGDTTTTDASLQTSPTQSDSEASASTEMTPNPSATIDETEIGETNKPSESSSDATEVTSGDEISPETSTTTSESDQTTAAVSSCPDGYIGNMAHPELCNQYYKCSGDEEPLLESCSDGIEFDPETKECVEVADGGCGSLQPEPSLPGDTTTTDASLQTSPTQSDSEASASTETTPNPSATIDETETGEINEPSESSSGATEATSGDEISPESSTTTSESDQTTVAVSSCPDGYIGNMAHPELCNQYFKCSGDEEPLLESCSDGMEFDPETKECVEIAEGGCGSLQPEPSLPGDTTTADASLQTLSTQSDSEASASSETTPNPSATIDKTGTGETNEPSESSSGATKVTSGDETSPESSTTASESDQTTVAVSNCPDGYVGNLAHPELCNQYFKCSGDEEALLESCSDGMEFDPETNECVEIAGGGCGSLQPQTSPPGDTPKTDASLQTSPTQSDLEASASTEMTPNSSATIDETETGETNEPSESSPGATEVTSGDEISPESSTTISKSDQTTVVVSSCPDGYVGNMAHPELCNQYFKCSGDEEPLLESCSDGMEFDPETKECVEIAEGGCGSLQPETSLPGDTTTTDASLQTSPTQSNSEASASTEKTPNPSATIDETGTSETNESSESSSGATEATSGDEISPESSTMTSENDQTTVAVSSCPDGRVGNVAHPELCNQYFKCTGDGKPLLESCSDGMEFDPETKECVKIAEGGCGSLQPETSPPGDTTTTDASLQTSRTQSDSEASTSKETTLNPSATTDETETGETNEPLDSSSGATEATSGDETSPESSTTTSESDQTTAVVSNCPEGYVGYIAHPELCNQYFKCSGDEEPLMEFCSDGMEFDPETKECVEEALSECNSALVTTETYLEISTMEPNSEDFITQITPVVTEVKMIKLSASGTLKQQKMTTTIEPINTTQAAICPHGYVGNTKHPDLCNYFYKCTGDEDLLLESCSDGMEFDPEAKECVEIAEGGCASLQPETSSPDTTTTYVSLQTSPTPSDSDVSASTDTTPNPSAITDETKTGETNEPSESFSGATGATSGDESSPESSTTISESDQTTAAVLSCPDGYVGNMAHPELCNQYFKCSGDEKPLLESCSDGMEFDPETKECIEIAEGGCGSLQPPETSPPGDTPTTDTSLLTTPTQSDSETSATTETTPLPSTTTDETETGDINVPSESTSGEAKITSEAIEATSGSETSSESSTTTSESDQTTAVVSSCPDGYVGNMAHPELCNQYFKCTGDEEPLLEFCNDGMEFDPETKECVEIAKGGCGSLQSETSPPGDTTTTDASLQTSPTQFDSEASASTETTPNPSATTDETETGETNEPLKFSSGATEATSGDETSPESSTMTSESDHTSAAVSHCPEGYFGNIAHPELCNQYFKCSGDERPLLEFCNDGMEFDPETKECVEIAEGGCGSLQPLTSPLGDTTRMDASLQTSPTQSDSEVSASTEATQNPSATTDETETGETNEPAESSLGATEATSGDETSPESSTTTSESDQTTAAVSSCPDGYVGNMAHPELCNQYFKCSGDEEPLLESCSDGMEFDPETKECIEIAEGGCGSLQLETSPPGDTTTTDASLQTSPTQSDSEVSASTDTTSNPSAITNETGTGETNEPSESSSGATEVTSGYKTSPESSTTTPVSDQTTAAVSNCPDGYVGNMAHPEQCNQYFKCSGDKGPLLESCSDGMEFDPETKECVEISGGGCGSLQPQISPPGDTPKTDASLQMSPTHSDSDVSASTETTPNPSATTDETGTGETNEPSESSSGATEVTSGDETSPESSTTTSISDQTTAAVSNCPEGYVGNMVHPELCNQYFKCSGDKEPLLETCSDGMEFDPETKECVEKAEGGCGSLQLETSPPGDTTTTEASLQKSPTQSNSEVSASTDTTLNSSTTIDETETGETNEPSESSLGATERNSGDENSPESSTTISESDQTTAAVSSCPDGYVGNMAHPELCNQYFKCSGDEEPLLESCSDGMEFDPETKECIEIAEGGCGSLQPETSPPGDTTTTDASLQMSPTQSDSEVSASTDTTPNPSAITNETGTGETNEPSESSSGATEVTSGDKTSPESSTTTSVSDQTTAAVSNCPEGYVGNMAHPELCNQYFKCSGDEEPLLESCSDGMEFDLETKECVEIAEGGCGSLQRETSSPGDITTTDASLQTSPTQSDSEVSAATDTTPNPSNTTAETETGETNEPSESSSGATEATLGDEISPESSTVTSESDQTTAAVPNCPDGYIGNMAHPELCNQYFKCTGDVEPLLESCSDGLEFSPETKECVEEAESGCTSALVTTETYLDISTMEHTSKNFVTQITTGEETTLTPAVTEIKMIKLSASGTLKQQKMTTTIEPITTTQAAICPDGHIGNIKHPDLCNYFYKCTGDEDLLLESCSDGMEFDPEAKECVEIAEGGCGSLQSETSPPGDTPPTDTSLQTSPTQSDSEASASTETTSNPSATTNETESGDTNVPSESTSGETEVTSEAIKATTGGKTSPESSTTTPESDQTTAAVSTCPDGYIGNMAHPELCNQYFKCTGDEEPRLESCSDGMEFDSETKECVEIAKGGCGSLQPETSPPGDTPTTDASHQTSPTQSDSEATASTETTPNPSATTDETETGDTNVPSESTSRETEVTSEATKATTGGETSPESSTTTPESDQTTAAVSTCPDGYIGNMAHPELCNQYFKCTGDEEPLLESCSDGMEFDPETKECVEIAEGGCGSLQPETFPPGDTPTTDGSLQTSPIMSDSEASASTETTPNPSATTDETETGDTNEPSEFSSGATQVTSGDETSPESSTTTSESDQTTAVVSNCPDGYVGYMAHPELCNQYFKCTGDEEPLLESCSDGMEFDPETKECVEIAEGGCGSLQPETFPPGDTPTTDASLQTSPTQSDSEASASTETTPNPSATTEEIETVDTNVPSESTLGETEVTSEATEATSGGETSPESSTTTSESDQTTAAVLSCPDGYVGNMAHPEQCNQYFKCTGDEEPLLESCSDGMEFDPETKECVEIAAGGCGSLQPETSPPGDTTTTDASLQTSPTQSDLEVSASTDITPNPSATTDETETGETNDLSKFASGATQVTSGDERSPESSTTISESDQTTAAVSNCPDGYVGNMAHPELCNQYFKCCGDEEPLLEFCSDGMEFDPETKECVEIAEGGCGSLQPETFPPGDTPTTDASLQTSPTQSDSEASASTEMTPNPSATTEETETVDTNVPSESTLGETEVTSEATEATSGGETSPESSTTTSESDQTTAAVLSCPDGYVGNMAHPEQCNQYFKCTGDEEPLLDSCSDGMEFDPETKECVRIAEGGCGSLQPETSPPGDTTTTDASLQTSPTQSDSETSVSTETTPNASATTDETETGDNDEPSEPTSGETEVTSEATQASSGGETSPESSTTTSKSDQMTVAVLSCPDGYVGNMAHPELCNQYFKCTRDEEPLLESCSDGMEFDPETKECVEIAEGGCGSLQPETSPPGDTPTTEASIKTSPTQSDSEASPSTETTPNPSAITDETETGDTNVPSESISGETAVTSEATEATMGGETSPESSTTTPESDQTTALVLSCPDGYVGNMAHPELCNQYFKCSGDEEVLLESCTDGMEFDIETKECVEIAEGGCGSLQPEISPPGDTTTTDASFQTSPTQSDSETSVSTEKTPNPSATTDETETGDTNVPLESTSGETEVTSEAIEATWVGETSSEPPTAAVLSCPDGYVGNMAHPELCNQYFKCSGDEEPQLEFCSDGMEFDPEVKECVVEAESGCTSALVTIETSLQTSTMEPNSEDSITQTTSGDETTSASTVTEIKMIKLSLSGTIKQQMVTTIEPITTTQATICPDGYVGNMAHLELCNQYFKCTGDEEPLLESCSDGMEFSPEAKECVKIAEGGCGSLQPETSPPGDTPIPDASLQTSPTQYDSETSALTETTPNPSATMDETETGNTNVPSESASGATEATSETTEATLEDETSPESSTTASEKDHTTAVVPSCPDGYVGNMAHPELCNQYVKCTGDEEPLLESCSDGMEFDPETKECVEIEEGGCGSLQPETTPPGDTPTTDASLLTSPTQSGLEAFSSTETTPNPSATIDETETGDTNLPSESTLGETKATSRATETTTEATDATSGDETSPGSSTTTSESDQTTAAIPGCPDGYVGNMVHPDMCNHYFKCTGDGEPLLESCSNGMEFDPETKECREISEGGCGLLQPETTPYEDTPTTDASLLTSPTQSDSEASSSTETTPNLSATIDVIEIGDTNVPSELPSGATAASSKATKATSGDEISPESSTTASENDQTTAAVPSCPDGYVGNMAHPKLCTQYFKCTRDDGPLLESCSDGMEFNPETMECVEIAEGGCSSLQLETTPPGDTPTTDASLLASPTQSDSEASSSIEKTPNPSATIDETETGDTNVPSELTSGATEVTSIITEVTSGNESSTTTPGSDPPESTSGETEATSGATEATSGATEATSEATDATLGDDISPGSSTTASESDQTTAAVPSCPEGYVGNMAHPELCNQYFKCTGDEEPLLESCNDGTEFDPEMKECVEIAEGGCGSLQPETSTPGDTPTADASFLTSPTQSDSEASSSTETTRNPSATIDETETGDTNEPSESTSGATEETSEATEATSGDETSPESTASESDQMTAVVPSCPDGYVGNMAHPELCNQYFKCTGDEEPLLESCSDGMEFDPEAKGCIEIAEGGCTLSLETSSGVLPLLNPKPDGYEITDTSHPSSVTESNSEVSASLETATSTSASSGEIGTGEISVPSQLTSKESVATTDETKTGETNEPSESSSVTIEVTSVDETSPESATMTSESDQLTAAVSSCPDGYVGNMAHPELCNQYFKCTGDEEPLLESCSDGMEFDPEAKVCVEEAESGCTIALKTTEPYPETSTTMPNSEDSITQTTSGEESISASTVTEIKMIKLSLSGTIKQQMVTTIEQITTTQATICPDGYVGNMAHLELCNQYFKCTGDEEPLLESCSDGMEFSPEAKECIEIADGGCGSLQPDTSPHGDTPTTDASLQTSPTQSDSEASASTETIPYPSANTDETEVGETNDPLESASEATEATSGYETSPESSTMTSESDQTTAADSSCPDGYVGNMAHPELCNQYFKCTGDEEPLLESCSDGMEFNPEAKKCVEEAKSGCTSALATTETSLETSTIEANSADSITQITSGEETGDTTSAPVVTNMKIVKLSMSGKKKQQMITTTMEPLTTTEAPLCPVGYVGNMEHPDLCNYFYKCTEDEEPLLDSCAPGLAFDDETKECGEIAEDVCTPESLTTLPEDIPTTETTPITTTTTELKSETSTTTQITPASLTTKNKNKRPNNKGKRRPGKPATTAKPTTTTKYTICPDGYVGNVEHPELCNYFYKCTGDAEPLLEACADGLEFDPETMECGEVAESACSPESSTTLDIPITATTLTTSTPHLGEETTLSSLTKKNENKRPNYSKDKRRPGKRVTTLKPTTTTPAPICPDGYIGNVEHPELCNYFFKCTGDAEPLLEACSDGLEFDSQSKECGEVAESECASDFSTTETSLTTSTSESTTTQRIQEETTDILSVSKIKIPKKSGKTRGRKTTTTTTPAPICSDGYIGNVEHPELCNYFYKCTGDAEPLLEPCADGLEFDPGTMECGEVAESTCSSESSTTLDIPTTVTAPTTSTPHLGEETTLSSLTKNNKNKRPNYSKGKRRPGKRVTTLKPTTTKPAPICPDGYIGNVEHPELCNYFVKCTGDAEPLLEACTDGLEFDSQSKECGEVAESECAPDFSTTETSLATTTTESTTTQRIEEETTDILSVSKLKKPKKSGKKRGRKTTTTTTPAPICPDGYIGNVEHPELCNYFFKCTGDAEPLLEPCADGLEFDLDAKECIEVAESGCSPDPSTTTSEGPPTETSLATSVIELTSGVSVEETIDPSMNPKIKIKRPNLFGKKRRRITTSTLEPPTTTEAPICPDDYVGNVEHPELCNYFYKCTGDQEPVLETCAEGLEFDSDEQECIEVSESGCTPDSSTSSKDITTTFTTTELNSEDPTTTQMVLGLEITPIKIKIKNKISGKKRRRKTTTTTTLEPTTTTEAPICPDGYVGNVEHPELCNYFYKCSADEVPLLVPCTEGLEFDYGAQECIVVDESGCSLDNETSTFMPPLTTEPTTEPPTTFAPSNIQNKIFFSGKKRLRKTSTTLKPTEMTTESEQTTTSEPLCPDGYLGNTEHPELCSKFYKCTEAGEPVLESCDDGFEFDTEVKDCVEIAEGGCTLSTNGTETNELTKIPSTEQTQGPTTELPSMTLGSEGTVQDLVICAPGYSGNVPHPAKCNQFFMCTGGTPLLMSCSIGEAFDPQAEVCTHIAEGHCTLQPNTDLETTSESVTMTTDQFPITPHTDGATTLTLTRRFLCNLGVFDSVPDPVRCDAFYLCSSGVPIQLFCPQGFEFDPEFKICAAISTNGCTSKLR